MLEKVQVILALLISSTNAQSTLNFAITIRDFLPSACLHQLNDASEQVYKDAWEIDDTEFGALSNEATSRCELIIDAGNNDAAAGYRELLEAGVISGHPDFESQNVISQALPCDTVNLIPVGSCLDEATGEDGQQTQVVGDTVLIAPSGLPKPPYCNSDGSRCGEQISRPSGSGGNSQVVGDLVFTQSQGEFFESWYNDDRKYNRRFGTTIELSSDDDVVFEFDSDDDGFFGPLNQFKSGSSAISFDVDEIENIKAWPQTFEEDEDDLSDLGFWFTSELHTTFQFNATAAMVFTFSGDDDFWAYINGKLAIDLGGVHAEEELVIDLNEGTFADQLDLEDGQIYTLDIFHAERQTVQSNFRLTTNLFPACNVVQSGTQAFDFSSINSADLDTLFFAHPKVDFNTGNSNSFLLQTSDDINSGTFIYTAAEQNVGRGFRTTFSVSIEGNVEGFALVVQEDTLDDYPISTGRNFNFRGLKNSFAVLFDLCLSQDGDCTEKRVSVQYPDGNDLGGANSASDETLQTRDSLFGSMSTFDVEIIYFGDAPNFLEVTIDNSLYLRESNFDIEGILGGLAGFVGLTASSSSFSGNIEISNWQLETVEVDPTKSQPDFDPNNIVPEPFAADGETPSSGFSVQTSDFCENLLDTGDLDTLFSAVFIEVLGNEEDESGRRLQASAYANNSTVPDVIVGDIVDNRDGSYTIQMVTQTVAEYRMAFTFGEGCTLDVNIDEDSVELQIPDVVFSGGDDCFTIDIQEPAVNAVPPELAPTRAPVSAPDDDNDDTLITAIASAGGGLLFCGLIAAMVLVRYRRKWNRDKGYVVKGNIYKLEANTAFDRADEYTKTGTELLKTQEEILRLNAQAQADQREGEINSLQQENENLKSLIRDSRMRLSNNPEMSTQRPAQKKGNRKRMEF
eukprot:augustus_masked-scaffold_42-processed-gene-1.8-mRNA-1 protein AED:1.00 eAED:1.00 QI:0/-1/0/0/-1/1/1/0/908